ncbi:MAG TPA: peptidoglycan-associated lipoprotein Pal [bacterium]|nr:peptidoglycan-associated lipoprotein Pal [bacterium]HPO51389.1 peptidoglycan-associated lipoprotein Pal [bacterium]
MKSAIKLLMCISVLMFIFSGCCPYSKKPVPQSKVEPTTSEQPSVTQQPTVTPPTVTTTQTSGTATSDERLIATTGGEIPPVKPPETPIFVEPGEQLKSVFQPIYFDFDRYNIKTSEQGKLQVIANYLKKFPSVSILIEGHCDERGTDEYNLVLGEQRALSTRNFLIGLGISPNRLYTISYGEAKPADPGHNEEAWSKNRRCEFKIKQ